MGRGYESNGREAVIEKKSKGKPDTIKKRDKGWRVSKNNDKRHREDNEMDIESEFLMIQGLIRCIECELPYPLELTECPHCIKNNKPYTKD